MPASPEAFEILNGSPVVPASGFSNSVIAGPHTAFYFLADIFVLPRPFPLANVLSLGDVMIGVGGAFFIVAVMHGREGAFAQFPAMNLARRVRPINA
jgi:hypothetical protein